MASIAAVFLAAAIAVALRRAPWCDEAWFACAGFNLAAHGKLIPPVIAPAPDDPKTLGLGLHTYWVMPLHLLFQAGWYKLFGFSLFALRSVSILWGLVALWSWFWIMRALTGETPIAVLTVALLGTDFVFILFALRSVSILWGLVALWSWFWIMRALTGETPIAVLTVALLGTDFVFI